MRSSTTAFFIRNHEWSNYQNERKKIVNNKFDELTKSMAQSVTRRGALKKFGLGVVGIALAALGLPNEAQAFQCNCKKNNYGCDKPNSPPNCITMCAGACRF